MLAFRTATAADIPLLRDLARRIWGTSYAEMLTPEQIEYMLAWMYSPEKIAAELADGVLWEIALLETEPVGYLAITFQGQAELNKLYLLPEHQGRGLGQSMIARALEVAAARGCGELRLRVNKQNSRALRAYERAGFRVSESLVSDIGGGFVMDDYVLVRAVTPPPV
ncbi:MAG: diamine N-acetyltransferase [Chthoniobacter sp.]|jgi:GNAT superfamily N-acetyltransferase|nr:diamine N-acetyltransferase [Chthoniobacter sp.]